MATLAEVLEAFQTATRTDPLHLAGGLLAICAGVGGVLALAWAFRAARAARLGAAADAPRVLLLSVMAFLVLLSTLGIFYR